MSEETYDSYAGGVEKAVLHWIESRTDKRWHSVGNSIVQDTEPLYMPSGETIPATDVEQAIWSLMGKGLLYIAFEDSVITAWRFDVTDIGHAVLKETDYNPYDADEYLGRINNKIPNVSSLAMAYAREALLSFRNRCYLASAVMLGVASEAAFLEMALSFGQWLTGNESEKFLEIVNNPRQLYLAKFAEFRKRIDSHKNDLPADLSDGMSLAFDAVLDLLRIYRNDSGHPTGKQIDRADAYVNLQMFARYLEKLYQFKAFFESGKQGS